MKTTDKPSSLLKRISGILLLLTIILGIFQFYVFSEFLNKDNDQLEQFYSWGIAEQLRGRFEPYLKEPTNYQMLQRIAKEYTSTNPKINIYLLNSRGEAILDFSGQLHDFNRSRVSLSAIKDFLSANANTKLPIYGEDPARDDYKTIFSVAKFQLDDKQDYYIYVLLKNTTYYLHSSRIRHNVTVTSSVIALAFSALSTLLVSFTFYYFLARKFKRMNKVVSEFESGNFTDRIKIEANDEIDHHAIAINKMADAIESNLSELDRRDRLRRELIANISHDLRMPVAVISGYAETLAEEGEELSAKDRESFSKVILNNTLSLTQLLSELFELAKLEAKEIQPKIEEFGANDLIENLCLSYQSAASENGIRLLAHSESKILKCKGDVFMIERVLRNLLENAFRYTPQNGTITLAVREQNQKIRFLISDTGCGIPSSDLPHVFDTFYQVQNTKGKNGLSGLGLAIVKKIIQAHGSEIHAESKENEGTTFWFELEGYAVAELSLHI